MLYWIGFVLFYLPIRILYPTKVIGRKNLPKGKAIYAPNHQTNVDIIDIAVCLRKRLYFLGKKELFKNKFFGYIIKKLGCIKIDRGNADIEAVKTVISTLKKKNKPIVIFPTGTRKSSPEELEEIKNGVSMFSLKTQSPIVPMVLTKRPRLFRLNKFIIGEPLDLSKYEGRPVNKELYKEISNDLENAMKKLLEDNKKKETK